MKRNQVECICSNALEVHIYRLLGMATSSAGMEARNKYREFCTRYEGKRVAVADFCKAESVPRVEYLTNAGMVYEPNLYLFMMHVFRFFGK